MNGAAVNISVVGEDRMVELHPRRTEYAVLIPVLNEGQTIIAQLARMQAANCPADVILSDGGSQDGSMEPERLSSHGVRSVLVTSQRGLGSASGAAVSKLRVDETWLTIQAIPLHSSAPFLCQTLPYLSSSLRP